MQKKFMSSDITYLKGSSLLRMMRYVLGPKIFQEAIQDYIATYKYGNANHDMFFQKLTDVSSMPAFSVVIFPLQNSS